MEISNGKTGASRNQGWHLVRVGVAGLLLTASTLKCWQLATEPIIGAGLLDSRWLLMATVECELFFGIWLLANIWAKLTWVAALACFGLFTCVSLYKALSGYASCGCFGPVQVNPWYTTTLDLAIVLSLLLWRPKGQESLFGIRFQASPLRVTAVLVVWVLIGVPAGVAMGNYTPATLSDAGDIIGDGKIVVLEPEKWIGKRFPLLSFIVDPPVSHEPGGHPLRERLAKGNWIVVLVHSGCPRCEGAILKFDQFARRSLCNPTAPSVALVEVPPYSDVGDLSLLENTLCAVGRLSVENEWFVETPTQFALTQGRVVRSCVTRRDH